MKSKLYPKKYLGQHFLKDTSIAQRIADTIDTKVDIVIEVGPGMGVLTQYLLRRPEKVIAVEVDHRSVAYLQEHFLSLYNDRLRIISGDFLKIPFDTLVDSTDRVALIGNYPYNISSQILFKAVEYRSQIVFFSGMFQREVAQRICAPHGNKTYGIISILVQAYYDVEYLFTVSEEVFNPPPKVKSAVIRLRRKDDYKLDCNADLFVRVVKTAFNQRRKTLRNSLKSFQLSDSLSKKPIFGLRPEQLRVSEFVSLTRYLQDD